MFFPLPISGVSVGTLCWVGQEPAVIAAVGWWRLLGIISRFIANWLHCKNIFRFYGKITGNQLPVHFPLFFTGARKHFQESGTER